MARVHQFIKLVFHIVLFITLSYFLNQKSMRPVKKIERFLGDMKHLLLWTKLAGIEEEGQQLLINHKCLYINCYLTTNRSLLDDIRYFDGILFNVKDLDKTTWDLPTLRSPIQKYIFVANDSAEEYPVCSPIYDGFFNWTWSYRYVFCFIVTSDTCVYIYF